MKEACEKFMALVEEGEYYEAHEALEDLWYPRRFEKDPRIRLIKGYINASTAFELLKRGRREAALRTWKVYLKYRPLSASVDADETEVCRRVEELLERTYRRLFEV